MLTAYPCMFFHFGDKISAIRNLLHWYENRSLFSCSGLSRLLSHAPNYQMSHHAAISDISLILQSMLPHLNLRIFSIGTQWPRRNPPCLADTFSAHSLYFRIKPVSHYRTFSLNFWVAIQWGVLHWNWGTPHKICWLSHAILCFINWVCIRPDYPEQKPLATEIIYWGPMFTSSPWYVFHNFSFTFPKTWSFLPDFNLWGLSHQCCSLKNRPSFRVFKYYMLLKKTAVMSIFPKKELKWFLPKAYF